jgi:hypothetical protein
MLGAGASADGETAEDAEPPAEGPADVSEGATA